MHGWYYEFVFCLTVSVFFGFPVALLAVPLFPLARPRREALG